VFEVVVDLFKLKIFFSTFLHDDVDDNRKLKKINIFLLYFMINEKNVWQALKLQVKNCEYVSVRLIYTMK